jgi:hypothetical protein
MAGAGLRKPEIDRLKLRLRQLESLHRHGLGAVSPCREVHETRTSWMRLGRG